MPFSRIFCHVSIETSPLSIIMEKSTLRNKRKISKFALLKPIIHHIEKTISQNVQIQKT